MAEYSTLKVPELKKLLADKKLPQTGNKADLIARLQEDDAKSAKFSTNAAPAPAALDKEDEIDYTDDDEAAPLPAAAATAAPKAAEPKQPAEQAKSQQTPVQTAAHDSTAKAEEPAGKTASAEPPQTFAMGLSKTAAEAEAKKRADRAKRFGIDEDGDAKRRAERAKRFGIDETELASGLDSALPEKSLKRGRGRGADDDTRAGKRQNVDRRGDRQGRNGRNARVPRQAGNRSPNKRGGIMDDPSERAKAEQRAARFAAI